MDQQTRNERLLADQQSLLALVEASTVLRCAAVGQPPDRYELSFHGKGLARDVGSHASIGPLDLHHIELRLPFGYPESPPDVRWLTPLWHPAVSFSGFVNLADLGLTWSPEMPLDVVCERLWDVARAAYFHPDRAANFAAKNWYESDCRFTLPVDSRPLRDRALAAVSNVVRYERRGARSLNFTSATVGGDVLFIDEQTPTPELPLRQPYVPAGRRRASDDDVLYIGPE